MHRIEINSVNIIIANSVNVDSRYLDGHILLELRAGCLNLHIKYQSQPGRDYILSSVLNYTRAVGSHKFSVTI